jgi:hypothetical protein
VSKVPPKKPTKANVKGRAPAGGEKLAEVVSLIDRAKAHGPSAGEDDALGFRGFETMARSELRLPADAHVIGEPITVTEVRYPNLPRVGLVATCLRGDHAYDVSFADVVFPPGGPGAAVSARYREWLGLQPTIGAATTSDRPHKVAGGDIPIGAPVDLIVLACKSNAIRCRLLDTGREVTLRTAVRDEVPGSIITVTPTKQWTHARHPYLSGTITGTRYDARELGLTSLVLHEQGEWDPDDEYWGEEGEPIEAWAKPIIQRGKRPMFELEQILPGADPDDFDSDPILEASELRAAGDVRGAYDLLMKLLAQDLRCLDAHAHLGNLELERNPELALRHYEMGTSIGGLTLGKDFDGVLAWGLIDNRPFLRCLHGVGLCAWRLGDVRAAKAVFTKMLWLNPRDNQGARFNLAAVDAGKTWEEMEGDEA